MATARVEFTPDWDYLKHHWGGGKFGSYLVKEVRKATTKASRYVRDEMRKRIQTKKYTNNAELTALLKRKNHPLVHDRNLLKGIKYKRIAWNHSFVGLLRQGMFAGGLRYRLAVYHHGGPRGDFGLNIAVTSKMRAMFTALSLKSHGWPVNLTGRALELWNMNPGIKWKALRPDTTTIKVPARPFVRDVYDDRYTHLHVKRMWVAATIAALKRGKRRGTP